ncbi:hypothetical protein ATANTOWER_014395 [Ataeniobius toweri]|uniref:Uncharacterized protein n=1 Tax=Ataeniobius toweri TaxID=208326 RepID=A0ABU7CB99_9TELE|nr:hypothetical protein [Ataeniobius toweri]
MRLVVIFRLKVRDENKLFFRQLYTQTLDHKETPPPSSQEQKNPSLLHLFGVLLGVDTSLSTPTHCVKGYRQRPKNKSVLLVHSEQCYRKNYSKKNHVLISTIH